MISVSHVMVPIWRRWTKGRRPSHLVDELGKFVQRAGYILADCETGENTCLVPFDLRLIDSEEQQYNGLRIDSFTYDPQRSRLLIEGTKSRQISLFELR